LRVEPMHRRRVAPVRATGCTCANIDDDVFRRTPRLGGNFRLERTRSPTSSAFAILERRCGGLQRKPGGFGTGQTKATVRGGYQRKSVDGVASVATSASRLPQSGFPFSPSSRRSASESRNRAGRKRARSTRFSARRYSVASPWEPPNQLAHDDVEDVQARAAPVTVVADLDVRA